MTAISNNSSGAYSIPTALETGKIHPLANWTLLLLLATVTLAAIGLG